MDLDCVPSEDEIGGYVPLQRPSCSTEMMDQQVAPQKIIYSDEEGEIQSSSDDSDDDVITKSTLKRKLPEAKSSYQVENVTKKKKYNIWSNILQEESIENQFIDTQFFDKSCRGNESYNYRMKYFSQGSENPYSKDWNKNNDNEPRKKLKTKTKCRPARKPLVLSDLEINDGDTNERIAIEIAHKLNEPKVEIIERVVSALGRDRAVEIYNLTKEVEVKGGILTLNGSRRRTSGGVFLKLVKDQKLPRKEFDAIFTAGNDGNRNTCKPKKRKSKIRVMEGGDNSDELQELPLRYELELPNQGEESDTNILKNPPPSPVHHVPSESVNSLSLDDCFPSNINASSLSHSGYCSTAVDTSGTVVPLMIESTDKGLN